MGKSMSEILFLCCVEKRKSYDLETSWEWANDTNKMKLYFATVPLRHSCSWTNMPFSELTFLSRVNSIWFSSLFLFRHRDPVISQGKVSFCLYVIYYVSTSSFSHVLLSFPVSQWFKWNCCLVQTFCALKIVTNSHLHVICTVTSVKNI